MAGANVGGETRGRKETKTSGEEKRRRKYARVYMEMQR